MHTKIWSQNPKGKITWERLSHRRGNGTALDFKGVSCEYNPVEGSEFLDSIRREECLSS